jgi:hypothetical protein
MGYEGNHDQTGPGLDGKSSDGQRPSAGGYRYLKENTAGHANMVPPEVNGNKDAVYGGKPE